jgi:T5SS/PEP-CTERM-associated repeat protein
MSHLRQALLLLAALLSLAAPAARAQLVNDGETNVLSGVTTNLTGNITIGSNAPNTLLVLSNGMQLTTGGGFVMVGAGFGAQTSAVWVTGPGTSWLMSNQFYIGMNGTGSSLVISNGGQVINQGLSSIGQQGGFDFATVTGAGSLWSNQTLRVGYFGGTNQLTVADSGSVITEMTKVGGIGEWEGNTITVSGGGSLFSNTTELLLGENSGENTLIISNGGTVFSAVGNIGGYALAGGAWSNRVIIEGAGSSWIADRLSLGVASVGNQMLLTNGGTLRVREGGLLLGEYFTSSNNLLRIDGGNLIVTNAARTNTYDIRSGTNLFNSGYLEVDNLVMTNAAGAFVFNGGRLVTYGGSISNGRRFVVGAESSATPATWDVRAGAAPTILAQTLVIGSNVGNASLVITNGATLFGQSAHLGVDANSSNNRAVISGNGSSWTNISGTVLVGAGGTHNSVLVSQGGLVVSGLIVGSNTMSSHNKVMIDGSNSIWRTRTGFSVGLNGSANGLIITNGGLMDSSSTTSSGIIGRGILNDSDGNYVFVGGQGSRWIMDDRLYVGYNGSHNSMRIMDGGVVTNFQAYINYTSNNHNNTAVVSGAGSLWRMFWTLDVGLSGYSNSLHLLDRGRVENQEGSILGTQNHAIVSGHGSIWTNSGDLYVGQNGSNNWLLVTNGGQVFSLNGIIGSWSSNRIGSNSVTVAGAGSVWETRQTLFLGSRSHYNELIIANGGRVTSSNAVLGIANSNRTIVSGSNSLLAVQTLLTVGSSSSYNSLSVTNGGRVESGSGIIGRPLTGSAVSNLVLIADPGSMWSIGGTLLVGSNSLGNLLIVTNGGALYADNIDIGTYTRGRIDVAGSGSLLVVTNQLTIGAEGITSGSRLTINDGAEVRANRVLLGNTPHYGGHSITVSNGSLVVTNAAGTSALELWQGSNVLAGGKVTVDRLLVVDNNFDNSGRFFFHSGQLDVRESAFTNRRAFLIGNGQSPAVMNLVGNGTHLNTNGFAIQTNAMLTGNGTIIGSVTNFGTLLPGNSAGAITIHGDLRLRDSAGMMFEIGGLIPTNQHDVVTVTNFVEFAGTLSLSLLPGFLPEAADSFALMSFGSASGSFANVSGGRVSLTNNLASFAVAMSATNLVLSGAQYADTDGDGQGDLQEQAAGTDASDPASALAILSVTLNGAGHSVVRFQSVTGKSYRVEYSDNFTTWSEATGATFTNPSPGVSEWVDDGTLTGGLPAAGRAYRIGLQ